MTALPPIAALFSQLAPTPHPIPAPSPVMIWCPSCNGRGQTHSAERDHACPERQCDAGKVPANWAEIEDAWDRRDFEMEEE